MPSNNPPANHLKPTGTSFNLPVEAFHHAVDHAAADDGFADDGATGPMRAMGQQIIDGHGQDNDLDSVSPGDGVTIPWRSLSGSLPKATW